MPQLAPTAAKSRIQGATDLPGLLGFSSYLCRSVFLNTPPFPGLSILNVVMLFGARRHQNGGVTPPSAVWMVGSVTDSAGSPEVVAIKACCAVRELTCRMEGRVPHQMERWCSAKPVRPFFVCLLFLSSSSSCLQCSITASPLSLHPWLLLPLAAAWAGMA